MYEELWERWSECHASVDQQKRMESAKKAPLTPVMLDETTGTAHFKGSSGNHTTTLDHCSCVDFNRRKLPCKHMYRLAMELELLDSDFASDTGAIIEPVGKRQSLPVTVKRVESLTESQQILLLKITGNVRSDREHKYPKDDDFCALVSSDLIGEGVVSTAPLDGYKKTEVLALVDTLGLVLPDGVHNKQDIIDFIEANAADRLSSVLPLYSTVSYLPTVKYEKLHMYLHRKYDTDYRYSFEKNQYIDVPLLQTVLPDDDVTDLLIKYGHYKR